MPRLSSLSSFPLSGIAVKDTWVPTVAPTVIGSLSSYGADARVFSFPITLGYTEPQVGDINVVTLMTHSTTNSYTTTPPAGWIELVDQGVRPNLWVGYKVLDAADIGAVRTWTFSATVNGGISALAIGIRHAAFNAVGLLSTATGSGPITAASVTNYRNLSLNLAFFHGNGVPWPSTMPSTLAGWTLGRRTANGDGGEAAVFYKTGSAGASASESITVTNAAGPLTGIQLSFSPTFQPVIPTVTGIVEVLSISTTADTDLTIAATPTKFNSAGSIDLPYNNGGSGTGGRFTVANGASSGIFTVEMWRYHTTAPSGFDFIFEVKSNSGSFLMIELSGSVRGNSFVSGGPGWTVATNTWEHYVIVVNIGTGQYATGKNGARGINTDLTSIWTWSGALEQINFKNTLYGGLANGFADEVRVSTGDRYGLFTSSTYTTPTGLLSTASPTTHLFKVVA